MGSIGSVLSTAQFLGGIAGSQAARQETKQSQELALRQLQQSQALQEQQAGANAALDRAQITLNAQNIEAERKIALKRAVARQKANFGAQGVGAGGGSSQAVLLGMFDESEDELARRTQLDDLRLTAIDQNLSQGSALNVLQRTQMAERNRLDNLSSVVGMGDDLLSLGKRIF